MGSESVSKPIDHRHPFFDDQSGQAKPKYRVIVRLGPSFSQGLWRA